MTAPSYFKTYADADFDRQRPADVAVIMPTIIRPTMKEALQSVFRQAPARRIQILIGIDRPDGDVALIEAICAERPCPLLRQCHLSRIFDVGAPRRPAPGL